MIEFINFSEEILSLVTDTEYSIKGSVEKDINYKIIVKRYDESHEKSSLYMNSVTEENKINTYSELIMENDPFIVQRSFTAPETGYVIYLTTFFSSKQFLENYPTLDSFKIACQSMKITRGGSEILDYENEYMIQSTMPNTLRVSINLFKNE